MTERPAASFFDNLRASGLLSETQLDELRKCPEARDPLPTPLARVVLRHGWLTRFQLNAIAAGRAKDLTVGPYVLLDRLGEGGMGTVFKARHQHMNRVVALKVIRKEKLASADAAKRFYQEVQLAAALHHPNIVLAYDAGPVGNSLYMAMEYVEGIDLARLVKERGRLPAAQACDYVRQAALGLQHAHEKGLVHRDVKPANLLVSRAPASTEVSATPAAPARGDVVKLLDMGLARLQGAGDTGMTRLGAVIGSPDYLAPEQAMNSKAADIRADLYSLGCTLYYLLTGRPPFPATELTEALLKHQMEQAAPLAERGVEAPAGLQAVLDRLMAKDPADRYQTPAELIEDLTPFCGGGTLAANVFDSLRKDDQEENNAWASLTNEDTETNGSSRAKAGRTVELPRRGPRKADKQNRADDEADQRKKRLLVLAGVGAGAGLFLMFGLVAAGMWWKFGRTREVGLVQQPPVAQPTHKGPDTAPDEGKQAPPPVGGGNPAVAPAHRPYVLKENLPSFEFALANGGGVLATVETPRRLRVEADGGSHVVNINLPRTTIECFALTPDGRQVMIACSDQTIHLWRIGEEKELHILKGHTEPIKCLAVSPDGRLALSGGGKDMPPTGIDTAIRVWDLVEGKEVGKLQGHEGPVERVAFSPDGKRAVSVGGDGAVRVWDVPAARELVRLDALKPARPLCAAFSPDGNRLLVGDREGNLTLVDSATGGQVRRFNPSGGGEVWDVAFTPDGERAVVARAPVAGAARADVQVWGVDSGKWYQGYQYHTKTARRVVVDGGRLAYSSGEDGLLCRQVVAPLPGNLRGNPAPPVVADSGMVILPRSRGSVMALAFSPNGKRAAIGDRRVRLWDVEQKKELREFGETKLDNVSCVAWFADNRRLLVGSNRGQLVLFDAERGTDLMTFSGHTTQVRASALSPDSRLALTGAGGLVVKDNNVAKGPDGKPVFQDTDLHLWDVATGKEVGLFQGLTEPPVAVAFSADGKRVLAGVRDGGGYSCFVWAVDKPEAPRKVPLLQAQMGWAFSPDGREVAILGTDRIMRVCDPETGKELRRSEKLDATIRLFWSRDGRYIACGGTSRVEPNRVKVVSPVRLLDAATCKEVKQFTGHTNTVAVLDISPGGRYVLGAGFNDGVRLWERDSADKPVTEVPTPEKKPFTGHAGSVLAVAFSPDGKKLLSGGKDRTVRLWDVATGEGLKTLRRPVRAVTRVGFAGKGKQAVGVAADSGFTTWDLDTEKVIHEVGTGRREGWAISPDGSAVVVTQSDGYVNVDMTTEAGRRARVFHGASWGNPVASAFSPDGRGLVFATAGDGLIHVADLTTEKEVGKGFPMPRGQVTCLAVAPKVTHLVVADEKGLALWSLQTFKPVHHFGGYKEKVLCLAFSPDGKRVVTGAADATVRVWDAATGKELRRSAEHKEAVRDVAFSPDGKTIVSCGDGIMLWEWQKMPAKP